MPRKTKVDTNTADLFAEAEKKEIKQVVLEGLFIHEGVPHMRVAPAKWMMNSSLIYDQMVCRGNIMAVNLETRQVVFLADTDTSSVINNKRMSYVVPKE